jgi:hypothetical protein
MKLSQIKHALNESKKMIREAEEEFGGDNFDQFLASIKEIEKHARERRVLEPDYSKEDLLADIKREIPDVDDKVVSKMADFVFGHLGESTQVTEAQTAEELEVGEPVKITGNVQFQGATGVIDSFGTGKRFVIVDLGEQGLRSFHSSDVSFNAEEEQDEFEGVEESTNPQDTITMDVPLFIRTLEFAREDAKDDMDLHDAAENALKLSANGDTLTMDNYDAIVPSDAVEEAGPGFVDVTGWSSRDVQRLGYADDDYEEPRRNHGYGYNRPAAKPVLSGYYFYNVSPADENDATAIGLKKTKSGKWALAVYNTSGRSTTMKKQSADRAFGPGRWWAPKTESVGEAAEDTFVSALKGLKSWQVTIFNNYYAGKYSDYRGRYYYVIASSPEEAKQVVLDNADGILQDLLSMKSHNGKKILPRGSAIAITDKRIGDIKDGTEAGRMSTTGFKRMFGPQGPMMVKLSGGAVVDVQGQEQGVAEGKYTPASETEEDIFINGKKVGKITKITTKKGMVFYRAEIGNSYIVGADTREEAIRDLKRMRKDQGVAEGTEERGQNRLWQMITDYEQRAKATKNDIKKAHYLKMASELRGKLKTSDEQGVAEGYDKWGWHTSVANGKFMPTKYGNKAYVYLHDLDNEGSKGGPQLVTVNKPAVAKKLAQQFGGKVVKTDLNTYRIVKPAEQDVTEGKDNLESLRAKAKQISDKIDSIVQSGGRVGLDDPLSRQLKAIRNKIKQAKQGVAEDSVKVGDRVHHNEYGKGVVRSVSNDGKIIGVRYKNLTKNIN